ncbi:hypothetical protein RJ639_016034 [Escallonia herrerae]|uniref:RNA helicase n=1 Tax=Escallonia herrerae TaxID=1293975 RepID=A0AA88VBL4_9ASTE|nr:hypothetical protein RJ639_016034 [Escallonia herrerae]
MIRDTSPTTARRFGLSPNYNRRGAVPANFRSVRQPYRQFTHRPDRPPGSPAPPVPVHHDRPNFIVELRSTNTEATTRQDVLDLISKFKLKAEEVGIYDRGALNARLCFQQWTDALEATVHFWETCLNASSLLVPRLIRNLVLPSDTDELGNRLKTIFTEHVEGLFEGELVRKWQEKLSHVMEEIEAITALLRKPKRVTVHDELCMQRRGLIAERDLIGRRIREFKTGMECVLCYLEGKECGEEEGVRVLLLKGDFDWGRIYWLVRRECRRLDDGLPIYAFRQDILWQIHCQQIMVLIGETGSGKSTQLVQFLADSGVAGHDTIICTQPRKLAAISLAQRSPAVQCILQFNNVIRR